MLLRTAVELQAARIPPRKILASLRKLGRRCRPSCRSRGLRITAVGNDVTVRDGRSQWHADTGQLVMDFELAPAAGSVAFLQRTPARGDVAARRRGGLVQPRRGARGERPARRRGGVPAGPRRSIRRMPTPISTSARCSAKPPLRRGGRALRRGAARKPRRGAASLQSRHRARGPGPARRRRSASYHACLRLAPDLADAHYNAARLHQQLGDARQAVRHFNAYRRLQRPHLTRPH